MEFKLKTISPEGIDAALSKAEVYRFLNQAEEAESICEDVLAVQSGHQLALRTLGLALTDQFTGEGSDRYADAEKAFQQLTDAYERLYYIGLLHERRAKAQLRTGRPAAHCNCTCSKTQCTTTKKPNEFAPPATTTPSCAGTAAPGCCTQNTIPSGTAKWGLRWASKGQS